MRRRDDGLFVASDAPASGGPVECLGRKFASDNERREHYLGLLREKLKDPEFRKIEGFPIGKDEDILALSDPPYYTACPNPFIEDFVKFYGKPYVPKTDKYHREPFASDVSEGKTDPIYNAHAYHTKVPHKAVMRYMLHYTRPGDVVFDGFCGSGMTGVAAAMCADRATVESLGYRVSADGTISKPEAGRDGRTTLTTFSVLGARTSVLIDLSPAATFIASCLLTPVDAEAFGHEAKHVMSELDNACGWMFETKHETKEPARVNYTVWSDVFSCAECSGEIVFVREALNRRTGAVSETITCPHCGARSKKDGLTLRRETCFDHVLRKTVSMPKREPVLIDYTARGRRFQKDPEEGDLELLRRIASMAPPDAAPVLKLPEMQMRRVGRMLSSGIDYVHQFHLPRALYGLSQMWILAKECVDPAVRRHLLFFVEQAIWTSSVLNRYRPTGYSQVNQYLTGVFYVPSQHAECSPWYILGGKEARLEKLFSQYRPAVGGSLTATQDLATASLPESSVDYIFTDPPFGENIYYADLNMLVESWLGVKTAPAAEAIVDRVRRKSLDDYKRMMRNCFTKCCQVLKPGRWMTVEFHNSRNSVWNAIQEALQDAGFVVADVRTLDKQQGAFQQVVGRHAVRQDLIISAYKPNGGLEERFKIEAGTEDGAWDFTRAHLGQLPVFVPQGKQAEVIAERLDYLLYDRMLAFHVQRGVSIPLSAPEFYDGLRQRFAERDGMYFLPAQAAEYDKRRIKVEELKQLEIFVVDEASAVQWLRQELKEKPQTFQELHPRFIREIGGWEKHESPVELHEMLEENFLPYDGTDDVPSQIHGYLSSNYPELRKLAKDNPILRKKAKDRWYVPDPNKAREVEKLREKALLREFEDYKAYPLRRMKVFRLEAVRSGFLRAWQAHDYATIISVARKIPEDVLQEDPKLLMWYDQAVARSGKER